MTAAIGTFINFLDFNGNPAELRFQNFYPDQAKAYKGDPYIYGGFGYSGTTTDLDAGSVSALLVFAVSEMWLNQLKNICDNRYLVEVDTVWLDGTTLEPTGLFLSETFAVLGFDHDLLRVDLRLGDPLNAVDATIPREVLTRQLVGSLPASGSIPIT